jgi:hypothetical protein
MLAASSSDTQVCQVAWVVEVRRWAHAQQYRGARLTHLLGGGCGVRVSTHCAGLEYTGDLAREVPAGGAMTAECLTVWSRGAATAPQLPWVVGWHMLSSTHVLTRGASSRQVPHLARAGAALAAHGAKEGAALHPGRKCNQAWRQLLLPSGLLVAAAAAAAASVESAAVT